MFWNCLGCRTLFAGVLMCVCGAGKGLELPDGSIRVGGEITGGALGVMALAKNGPPVGGWQHVLSLDGNIRDWKEFKKAITVPEAAGHIMMILTVSGKGQVWLDELAVAAGEDVEPAMLPQEDLKGFQGPTPTVVNVGLLQPTVLSVELREFQRTWGKLEPYVKAAGDEIRAKKTRKDGVVMERELFRNGKKVGNVVGPENNLHVQLGQDSFTGRPLNRQLALTPATWTLTEAAGQAWKPKAVWLKQKPVGGAGKQMRDNWYCLVFDKPLADGKYVLDFGQYEMKQEFLLDPLRLRSEAVHVSHIGYRPDDPAKLGFLSYWSGTGGAVNYAEGLTFKLLEARTRTEVFQGKTVLRLKKESPSFGVHAKGKNYSLTDVYVCDFSTFNQEGEYVLYVEGVGCSFPFQVNREAWTTATRNSLRGFFHQRAGQEWKAPWADWDQPRAFHPDNGEDYWELSKSRHDIRMETGKRHEDVMDDGKFEEWKTGRKVANAWGEYYDAGDYDRHTAHLVCSRNMLELLELFPEYYTSVKLPIPESDNDLPDLLDEALWGINLYKRTQREDGGIYGGIETNGHPKPGEPAFLDSLTRYVFAPDPESCWNYAASAARAAFVLRNLGREETAVDYQQSALRAMLWAEKEFAGRPDYFAPKGDWQLKDCRNLAAVALYRVTKDVAWRRIAEETAVFRAEPVAAQWQKGMQEEAAFLYASLPAEMTEPALRANALAGIEAIAARQIRYSDGMGYMWTGPHGDPGFPLILSINAAPWGQALCRAHFLTKNERYLAYAVRSSLFSVGANPQNMTFTTRLGHRSPEFPLQCSRWAMHTPQPYSGYTVYGLNKMGPTDSWVKQWFVTAHSSAPDMETWPIEESYWDVESWPMVNENTVHQSMAPALYVWGYLAGRP